ncbi:hypothetical protein EDC01DRAFT_276602 [Geopyxis carbonaria]|nr:hypothetical protein EDC01DRAFT_276602 [Geopyxis carbonaria]
MSCCIPLVLLPESLLELPCGSVSVVECHGARVRGQLSGARKPSTDVTHKFQSPFIYCTIRTPWISHIVDLFYWIYLYSRQQPNADTVRLVHTSTAGLPRISDAGRIDTHPAGCWNAFRDDSSGSVSSRSVLSLRGLDLSLRALRALSNWTVACARARMPLRRRCWCCLCPPSAPPSLGNAPSQQPDERPRDRFPKARELAARELAMMGVGGARPRARTYTS